MGAFKLVCKESIPLPANAAQNLLLLEPLPEPAADAIGNLQISSDRYVSHQLLKCLRWPAI